LNLIGSFHFEQFETGVVGVASLQ